MNVKYVSTALLFFPFSRKLLQASSSYFYVYSGDVSTIFLTRLSFSACPPDTYGKTSWPLLFDTASSFYTVLSNLFFITVPAQTPTPTLSLFPVLSQYHHSSCSLFYKTHPPSFTPNYFLLTISMFYKNLFYINSCCLYYTCDTFSITSVQNVYFFSPDKVSMWYRINR